MAFKYDQNTVSDLLLLGELLAALNEPTMKDSIERFNTLYNESNYGPDCTFTRQSYTILSRDARLNGIFNAVKELADNVG